MMLELNFYPLDIFCIALIALLALVLPSQAISDRFAGVLKSSRDWLPLITGLFLVNYAAVVIYYINSPAIVDHGEIMVPAASWMFQSGHPLYTNMDDAARYSTIYGPVGHVFYAWAMGLLGPTIFACKIASGLAGLGSCLLAYLTFSKSFSRWIAWMATGLTAIYFLVFPIHTYLLKHDPFVIFFTALALWACTSLKARPAQILLAIATGMLVNLKPHSFLYTMPLLALHYQRAGLKSVIGASVGAVGVAVLPYLSKNISFWNWVAIMHSEAGAGFVGLNVLANTQWFAFLGVAFVALCYLLARNKPAALSVLLSANKWYLLSLGFSLFCVAVISSRNGSGPGHFVPLFQLVLYACCLIVEQLNTVSSGKTQASQANSQDSTVGGRIAFTCLAAAIATGLVIGADQEFRTLKSVHDTNPVSKVVYQDISDIMKSLPNRSISMGYGTTQTLFLSQHRLPLVFANQPYYFDFSAMQGYHDEFLSRKSHEVISKKLVDVWLIPRSEPPFRIRSFYAPNPELFDDEFRNSFADNYEIRGQSRFFDVYVAKGR